MNHSLAKVHPELGLEWSEKNLTLTPVTLRSVQIKMQSSYSSMQDYREHADTYRAMLGDYGWGFNYDESEK